MTLKLAWNVLAEIISKWDEHKVIRMGAALAYYGIFAIAPVLVIAIAIAGLVYGRAATEGNIVRSISGVVGPGTAQFIQELVESAGRPRVGIIAVVVGVAGILLGSVGYFLMLKDALNTVWEVVPKPGYNPMDLFRKNALSFVMVLVLGFLLLASLLLTAGLGAAGSLVGRFMPGSETLWQLADFGLTFGLVILLFACIFKILPDVHIPWGDIWPGAILTAVLFTAAQVALSVMIRLANPGLAFGAAGTLVVILVWFNLASLILLFGAEFIRVYSMRFGSRANPKAYAEVLTKEASAVQEKNIHDPTTAIAQDYTGEHSFTSPMPRRQKQPMEPQKEQRMTLASPSEPSQPQPIEVIDSVISAKHLTKKFGNEIAVQDVSFDVPRASIFGFIGPSGSGKTTTVRLLTGVYTPTDGQVMVLDHNPARFSQGVRARIGYMPQLFVLYPTLTVWENLYFAASLYGMSLFRGKRLKEALEFVELYEHRGKLARNISGGMLRRLSLASTLVHEPQLLFLDEPTAGIDPVLRHKFWDHFRELKDQGRTIFITTQYVSEADNCDLVGVQNNGKLLLVNTPQGIRHHAYGGDMVDFCTAQPFDLKSEVMLRSLPFVRAKTVRTGTDSMRIIVNQASTATPELMGWAQQQNIQVKAVEEYMPSFEDVFVELVRPEVSHE